jgi:exosortase
MTLSESIQRHRIYLAASLLLMAGLYYSIVPSMVLQWYQDDNYSHGFIVPFIAGYFLYRRLDEIKRIEVAPANFGLLVIIFALSQLTIAWLASEYFTLRSSLIVLLAGMVLYFFGAAVLKAAAMPILYLIFMVPLPYIIYDAMAFPLKLFVTKASVAFLKALGIAVVREGNIIMFSATTLEVADACSGIRSLVSLLALAVAYAFFTDLSPAKRWIVVLSAIPIAIFTNAMRVIGTGVLAQYYGARAAEGFFHEFAGLVVFALAMVMLVGVGALLKGREGKEGGKGK